MRIWKRFVAGVGLLALAMSAVAQTPPGAPLALRWVGDLDTANAVMRPLVTPLLRFEHIALELDPKTSTKGIRTVLLGQADIGGSGRYRIEGMPEESEVKFHPVAWDALVVVVHPSNPLGNIGIGDLKRLLLGKVTNWRQLGGADAPIRLIAHEDFFAGIDYVLMNQLFGSIDVEFAGAELVGDEFDIGGAVASDPNAVAVMSMASAMPISVKALSLNGVAPSVDTLKTGDYRLFRPLYLVRAPSTQNDEALDRIVRFVESARARPLIRAAGAVPYRQAVVLVVRGMDIQRALVSE